MNLPRQVDDLMEMSPVEKSAEELLRSVASAVSRIERPERMPIFIALILAIPDGLKECQRYLRRRIEASAPSACKREHERKVAAQSVLGNVSPPILCEVRVREQNPNCAHRSYGTEKGSTKKILLADPYITEIYLAWHLQVISTRKRDELLVLVEPVETSITMTDAKVQIGAIQSLMRDPCHPERIQLPCIEQDEARIVKILLRVRSELLTAFASLVSDLQPSKTVERPCYD